MTATRSAQGALSRRDPEVTGTQAPCKAVGQARSLLLGAALRWSPNTAPASGDAPRQKNRRRGLCKQAFAMSTLRLCRPCSGSGLIQVGAEHATRGFPPHGPSSLPPPALPDRARPAQGSIPVGTLSQCGEWS